MPFSDVVKENVGGTTRAFVEAWVEWENDKQAGLYVRGYADAWRLVQWGVGTAVGFNGVEYGWAEASIWCAGGSGNYAWCDARITVDKWDSARSISCFSKIYGKQVDGCGGITGTRIAYQDLWIGSKIIRLPATPSDLTILRTESNKINLSWKTNATNALSTQVERMKKGEDWKQIFDTPGAPSSYADEPGIGTFKYRVRHWNNDGFSAYSGETDYIASQCAPKPPQPISPRSGFPVSSGLNEVTFEWIHNSVDLSEQTEAELRWQSHEGDIRSGYKPDEASWNVVKAEKCTSTSFSFKDKTAVYWQVRTRGSHPDFSEWSTLSSFSVKSPPYVEIRDPGSIKSLPVTISWIYEDENAEQSRATLNISRPSDPDFPTICETIEGTDTSFTILEKDFTPKQGETYLVGLSVTSKTSLFASTEAAFQTDYEAPEDAMCALKLNREEASCTVTVYEQAGKVNVGSLSVFRDNILIAKELHHGQSCIDKTPPLDTEITYRVVAYALSGAVSESFKKVIIPSQGAAFFNFGDKVCRLMCDLSIDDATSNECVERVFAGSSLPKVFFGEHVERKGSVSATALTKDAPVNALLSSVECLKLFSGHVYMRLPFGDGLTVVCKTKISRSHKNTANVSVDWTEVAL